MLKTQAIRAEWIKSASVRSTWVLLALSILIMIGMTLLSAGAFVIAEGSGTSVNEDYVTQLPGSSIAFGGLMVAAFGVVTATSEWTHGTIHATVGFSRSRGAVILGKSLVVAGLTFLMSTATMLVSYLAVQPVLSRESLDYSIFRDNALTHMLGATIYLVLFALLSLGVGLLLRNTAAALVIMVAIGFVLPAVLGGIEWEAVSNILRFAPSMAGSQMIAINTAPEALNQFQGGAVMVAWVLAALGFGAVTFIKRDV